ncbi:MAG TPA: bifunctional 4-hydroxy-2-oxoglutarate aldolase/2-dehydro-3-deoxy-phosphogluconate aldolase [Steroidobacteraceae bacterium]|nr:bifunctional 4-hydroxy-2-oxoglutarate aldolase/2-dehydro-3-deoxy-phosphogluconate aldolase [Steroidobacteraceae bacterium]
MNDALLAILRRAPVVPVIVLEDPQQAAPLAEALVAGGLPVLEVTLRTSAALQAVKLMREAAPAAVVGVGTITTPEQFAVARDAGAQFGVSPGCTPELATAAASSGLHWLPGVMTPSEVLQAQAQGYTLCKLFPAQQAGGTDMLKALHAILPAIRFCPTGGISRSNAAEYLGLPNVVCVGGSWVVPRDLVRKGNWAAIQALASEAAALPRSLS